MKQMSSSPQHVVVSAFEGMRDFDPAEAGRRLEVPALYVEANEPQPRSDMARLREMFPQVQKEQRRQNMSGAVISTA